MFVVVAVLSVVDTALLIDVTVEEVDDVVEELVIEELVIEELVVEELVVDDEPSDDKKGAACFALVLRVATPTLSTGQPLSSHPI